MKLCAPSTVNTV